MQKYLPVDIEAGEAPDRSAVPRHRDMSHVLSGLGAEAGRNQLVVPPDRAIEEQKRRARKARFQLVRDMGASGDEVEVPARRPVADAKADRVAGTVIAAGM